MNRGGPVAPGLPGCCGYVQLAGASSATHCRSEPTAAGTIGFADGSLWCTFACAEHKGLLDDASPIGANERFGAELQRRRGGGVAAPVRPASAAKRAGGMVSKRHELWRGRASIGLLV